MSGMITCTLDEISTFKKMIEVICENIIKSDTNVHLYLPMKCEDIQHTFIVNEIIFRYDKNEETVSLDLFYSVFGITKNKEFVHTHNLEPNDLSESVVDIIFGFFYNYKLCPECLRLIEKSNELCSRCSYHKIRNVFGITKKWEKDRTSPYENCSICCHPVYNTKLQCGHYIHHTCVIQMSPFQWFYGELVETRRLKCPLCRKMLTEYDINRYFRCK